ncbi:MAG: hypothetical protein ABRQ37_25095 [Candidatus Eremiobacterota bacterium]
MIIKQKLTGQTITPQKNSKENQENSDFNLKDVLSLRAVRDETVDILTAYKRFKIDQTEGRKEAWWEEAAGISQVQGDVVKGFGLTGPALMASTVVSGIGAAGMTVVGVNALKEGLKEKDTWKTIEGTTALLAGASGAAVTVENTLAVHNFGNPGLKSAAGVAGSCLGVAFGVADMVLGGRELVCGIKEKNRDGIVDGSLEMGLGSIYVMSSLGLGGPVMAGTLLGVFASKLAYDYREELAGVGKKILNKIKGEEKQV